MREGYKEFACDLCGVKEAVEVPHVRRYTAGQVIHICKNCGFIYVKMRRPYDKIAEVWSKEMFGRAYTAKSPLMVARHNYVAEFIDQKIGLKDRRVFDVGAGEGQFLGIIKKNYGASVFGVEPSKANCRMMDSLGIKNFCGTLEEYISSRKKDAPRADIATLMWTLENAASCRAILTGAREALKEGGHIVVATGSRVLVPFNKPMGLYLSHNPVDTHPSRFSVNTLSSLLAKTGFRVEFTNPYLNDGLLLCVVARKAKAHKGSRIKGDDYRKVRDYFKRWHKESRRYA